MIDPDLALAFLPDSCVKLVTLPQFLSYKICEHGDSCVFFLFVFFILFCL